MNFEALDEFLKDVKRLNKKYPSLTADVRLLKENILENPFLGESLGRSCYKIRMAITSKGRDKSGGARVITCVKIVDDIVYLLTIFDKSEKENISDEELTELLKLTEA